MTKRSAWPIFSNTMSDECVVTVLVPGRKPSDVYKTSKKILKAQSPYFESLIDLSDNGNIKLQIEFLEGYASESILQLVAVAPGARVEQILTYPFLNKLFLKSNADRLSTIWMLLHKWDLHILIQHLKREVHAQLFDGDYIQMLEIMKMETMISPQNEELFFESCYGLGVARDVHQPARNDALYEELTWQENKTPIWDAQCNKLRGLVTRPPLSHCRSSEGWMQTFPCFRFDSTK